MLFSVLDASMRVWVCHSCDGQNVEAGGIANDSTHNRKIVAAFIEAGNEQVGIIMVGQEGLSALNKLEVR
jgi:hypothetical protein